MRLFPVVVLSFLLLVPASSNAQDIKFSDDYLVEVGKPYPVIDGIKYYFRAVNAVICVKVHGKQWMIQKLSAETLTQSSRKEYSDMPEDLDIEHIDFFGDRLFVFYSVWDKSNEREQLYYREIDTDQGVFKGKGVRMLAIKGKVSGTSLWSGFYRMHVTDKFDMFFSGDDKRLLVQYRKRKDKKDKDGPNEVSMAMFSPDLQVEWSADVRLPYDGDKMSIVDFAILASGEVCIVANIYTGTEEKVKNRSDADYHYELCKGGVNGAPWDITRLELSSKWLRGITLYEERASGALRASGFYSNANTNSRIDGVFTCSFDGTDNITKAHFHEIPNEVLNMYVAKRELKRNEKEEAKGEDLGFTNMVLEQILEDDDGSLLLIGEKRYITVECTTDSRGNTRCYNVYHADDLLVSRIKPDGSLAWMKRIPKRNASRAQLSRTYQYMNSPGEHHIMTFDFGRNLALLTDEIPNNKGMRILMVDRIDDATGTVSREAILDTEEVKGIKLYQLDTERLIRVANGEVLMEAYKKNKEDILLRIQVKE